MSPLLRGVVHHSGSGKLLFAGGKRVGRKPPSYKELKEVIGLFRYCVAPAKKSKGRERVAGIIDGMGLGLAADEKLSPREARFIIEQLIAGVPLNRRLVRHVILALAGTGSLEEQLQKCELMVRAFVATHAPGKAFIAVIHDDHMGEGERGLHVHLIIRNTDTHGRAIDWGRKDLEAQQSLEWASHLGISPTRGTGIPTPKGQQIPYTKPRKTLKAQEIGKMTHAQLTELIENGSLTVGRRNKAGHVTSIVVRGRHVRLSTARYLAQLASVDQTRGAGIEKARVTAGDGLIHSVGAESSHPHHQQPKRRKNQNRSEGLHAFRWRKPLGSFGKRKTGRPLRAIRAIGRAGQQLIKTLTQLDTIGRIL